MPYHFFHDRQRVRKMLEDVGSVYDIKLNFFTHLQNVTLLKPEVTGRLFTGCDVVFDPPLLRLEKCFIVMNGPVKDTVIFQFIGVIKLTTRRNFSPAAILFSWIRKFRQLSR